MTCGRTILPSAVATIAADIGAYFVLSQGSAAAQSPTINQDAAAARPEAPMIRANAIATASVAGISGYTTNELNRKGADSVTAAHANAGAARLPVTRPIVSVISAAAAAARMTMAAVTPG